MSLSLYSLNRPPQIFSCRIKPIDRNGTRRIPVLALPPSSVITQTEESGNSPNSNRSSLSSRSYDPSSSLLTQANSVGIIGGASVDAAVNFAKKLVKLNSEDEGGDNPFVLCSDPMLSKDLLSYETSSFSFLAGKTENLPGDHVPVVENLRRKRIFLENSGARCIVMPCHIAHSWYNEVAQGCSVPFLHMAECVARELKEARLRPLEAGSPLRIGVVASNATLRAGFYQEKLENEGFEVVLPDKATMEHTLIPAVEALSRNDTEGAQNLFRIALQVLLVRAVNAVIIASDDMREILPPDDPLLKKCVDPVDALVRSTVKFGQTA